MSPPKPLIDRARRGAYDELWTPAEALDVLIPHLKPKNRIIWECAPGSGQLAKALEARGFRVRFYDEPDFFTDKPLGSLIVTNPPFSKKAKFLERANGLNIPYAFLLPITALGSRECQRQLENCQIILLPRRIDFTGKGRPWFSVAWFCWGLGIWCGDKYEGWNPVIVFPEDK